MGRERAGSDQTNRNAYEVNVPPSAAMLSWLLNHPEQLTWPKATPDRECVLVQATQTNRKFLLAHEPTARTQALEELARAGASDKVGKWWTFEGFTSVDCLLETRSLLLLIEGKRTEAVSKSTDWFPGRNQVIRNLEVAQALAGRPKLCGFALCRNAVRVARGSVEEQPSPLLPCSDRGTDASLPRLRHVAHDRSTALSRATVAREAGRRNRALPRIACLSIQGLPQRLGCRGIGWSALDVNFSSFLNQTGPIHTSQLSKAAPSRPRPGQTKSPARRDGAWKVGGSNYESFSGFNLTWLMAFVGSEALRLTRVAESAA